MIRFNLRKLLGELEAISGRKITLRQVCADSGCDKNALSRMLNHPDVAPSSRVIDDLIQYFFRSFKAVDPRKRDDVLMREIIGKFISVYPDDFSIDELDGLRDEDLEAWEHLGPEGRWRLYNHLKYGTSVDFDFKPTAGLAQIGDGPSWSGAQARPAVSTKSNEGNEVTKGKQVKKGRRTSK